MFTADYVGCLVHVVDFTSTVLDGIYKSTTLPVLVTPHKRQHQKPNEPPFIQTYGPAGTANALDNQTSVSEVDTTYKGIWPSTRRIILRKSPTSSQSPNLLPVARTRLRRPTITLPPQHQYRGYHHRNRNKCRYL
jgi:hypothetical protein